MFLRIRSLLALELLGALSLRAISRHLDCAHSSAGSALHGLERGQLVWRIADTADPDHHVFDLTGRGHAVTDRFRYLLAECGIEESDHWESTRSDDVDAVLRMIQSLGNEIQMTGHGRRQDEFGRPERLLKSRRAQGNRRGAPRGRVPTVQESRLPSFYTAHPSASVAEFVFHHKRSW